MLNLLRPEQKKKIIREYHMRFFVSALSLLLAVEVISLILLIPSYFTIRARADDINTKSAALQSESMSEEGVALNTTIQKTNDYIDLFLSSTTPNDASSALRTIVDNKGGTVRINGIIYNVQNGNQQVVVQGIADSRQDLLDLVSRLKQQKNVISADLPISDFSQSKDINFSLTVVMKPENT